MTQTAQQRDGACAVRRSVVAFTSTRDLPFLPPGFEPADNWEVWLTDDGLLNPPQRLTDNFPPPDKPGTGADTFADLTRKGRIVFDSNRDRDASEPVNTSDLFLMNLDGTGQTKLTRGSSASWSPNGRRIAFHRSAQYDGTPGSTLLLIRGDPGAPAPDSRKILFSRTIAGVGQQVWVMNAADGCGQAPLTAPPGTNTAASWREVCAGDAGHDDRATQD